MSFIFKRINENNLSECIELASKHNFSISSSEDRLFISKNDSLLTRINSIVNVTGLTMPPYYYNNDHYDITNQCDENTLNVIDYNNLNDLIKSISCRDIDDYVIGEKPEKVLEIIKYILIMSAQIDEMMILRYTNCYFPYLVNFEDISKMNPDDAIHLIMNHQVLNDDIDGYVYGTAHIIYNEIMEAYHNHRPAIMFLEQDYYVTDDSSVVILDTSLSNDLWTEDIFSSIIVDYLKLMQGVLLDDIKYTSHICSKSCCNDDDE